MVKHMQSQWRHTTACAMHVHWRHHAGELSHFARRRARARLPPSRGSLQHPSKGGTGSVAVDAIAETRGMRHRMDAQATAVLGRRDGRDNIVSAKTRATATSPHDPGRRSCPQVARALRRRARLGISGMRPPTIGRLSTAIRGTRGDSAECHYTGGQVRYGRTRIAAVRPISDCFLVNRQCVAQRWLGHMPEPRQCTHTGGRRHSSRRPGKATRPTCGSQVGQTRSRCVVHDCHAGFGPERGVQLSLGWDRSLSSSWAAQGAPLIA